MAATTITRASMTNDSGAGTDGTVVDAAWIASALYDKFDEIFTRATLQQEASAAAGSVSWVTKNSAASGLASLILATNISDLSGLLQAFGSSYATSGSAIASTVRLVSNLTGGLGYATNAAPHRWWIGSANPMTLASTGHLVLAEQTTNPGTTELAADASVAIYTKADKLVFAYNDAGTMRYITLDLDGSDITWAHGSGAP